MSKVAIIGAGIIGTCTAHFLTKSGHDVTLYDHNEPGTQTSFGNAGLFAAHECITANSPHLWKNLPSMLLNKNGPLVIDWFYVATHLPWAIRFLRNCTSARVEHIAKSLSSFSSHAGLAYEEIFDDVNVSGNVVHKEPILLYETKELFEKNKHTLILRKKNGVHFTVINKEDIAEIEPHLEAIYYNGLVLKGESFTKSPLLITQRIFDNFIKKGGCFIKSKIKSIVNKNNSLSLIYEAKEQEFDKIVVAAGAWSNILARTIGDDFPLDAERGYHIIFENSKNLLTHPIGWAKTGFYMTPMEDGIRAAGTVEIAGLKKPMNNDMLSMIEKTARSILPQLGKVKSQWMGFRPTLPDSLPIIGESQKCKNVYYAFGHQHLGLSLAAVTGKVMRLLIENKNTNINIDALNPYRF
ncbi:FAD-binding oxidoreductase [Alphaproteobacteria bacterium]|nr:FAD-binding oxidoreductase [Alphaproteobacteria bacterium]